MSLAKFFFTTFSIIGENMHISEISIQNKINFKSVSSEKVTSQQINTDANSLMEKLNNLARKKVSQVRKACFITLKNEQGHDVNATLINNRRNKSMYLKRGYEDLGGLTYSISDAYIKGDSYPDYYKNKKYLFINSIYSNQQYKGIGSELIKQAAKESQKRGYEGRICLNSSTTKPEKGSPIPFYYKLGFRCTSKKKDEIIRNSIKNKENIPASCESVTLFLPKEAINKLLE